MTTIEQTAAKPQAGIRTVLMLLDTSIRQRPNLWMYSILGLGLIVRIWHASGTYLNPDEALHFFVANKTTWWETYRSSLNVSHPPLLIFLLRVWRGLGTSELMLRLPSILAGTAFCWFAYRWLSLLFEQSVVWIAFAFIVFLPSSIDLSTEVRQYALLLAFAMGSAYFLERAVRENSAISMLASGVFLWFALFSHFSAFLFAAVLGVYAILRMLEQRTPLKIVAVWELGQVVGVGICYWLYVTQISRLGQAYGGTNATKGWMGGDYLGNSYLIPGKINPFLFVFARTGGVFQYVFRQSVVGDLAFVLFVVGVVMILRGHVRKNTQVSNIAKPGAPRPPYTGILLLLPFVFNCAAALMRAYPYGGTRHSSFLMPFALAGVGATFFGIPLALAAFLSGIAISESREATEARERLLPFRDVFAVLFFVAIGALIDPGALLKGLGWLAVLLGLLVVGKVLPTYLLARLGRLPGRPRQIATGLGQIGEFSFVLATIGVSRHVIPSELYAAILAAIVLTIAASTLLVRVGYARPSRASTRI